MDIHFVKIQNMTVFAGVDVAYSVVKRNQALMLGLLYFVFNFLSFVVGKRVYM